MQTITPEQKTKKDSILKTLAVGGFIGLIVIIAWLGMQLVNVLPNALTSLASIADTVYNYEEVVIEVNSSKETATAGESFGLTWNVPRTPGDFTFTYDCTDGVAVDVRTIGGTVESVECDSEKNLGNVSGIDIQISSEKERSVEVPYSVAFIPSNDLNAVAVTDSSITVENKKITDGVAMATTSTPVVTPPVVAVTPKPVVTPTPPAKPVVAKPKPVAPKPVATPTYTYAIPVSNPNGFTDIATKLVNVGTLAGGKFTNTLVDNDNGGAILFEIKNIGTKTSESFTYTITLPNGTTYTSPVQTALKPNERVTAAAGFDVSNMIGVKSFSVSVNSRNETINTNNAFTGNVTIVD